ncbi:MAG: ABC transporter ATP-binding protein [Caulobacteraceae bacterium]
MKASSAPPSADTVSHRVLAIRMFRTYLAPRWRGLALAIALAVIVGALTGVLTGILNPVVKLIFEKKSSASLIRLPLLIIVLGLVRGVAQTGQAWITNRIGHRMVGDIQMELFGKLIRADLARLRNAHSGSYVSSVLYDAGLIREGATTGIVNYTQAGVAVIASLAVMLTQDLLLTVIVLCSAPLLSWVLGWFRRSTKRAAEGAMAETSALSTAVMESLDGVKLIKIDNREAYEEARVAEVVDRRQRFIIKGANARAAAAPATETLTMVVVALVIAYAGFRSIHGGGDLARFVAFLGALMAMSQNLRQVANLQTVITEGLTAAGRLMAAMDVQPEVVDATGARSLELTNASIRFEDVSFAYDAAAPALSGVNLEVQRGETVALVGPSGGGKSTILSLIPRFYDVTSGRVTIDGVDVRDVTMASLRDHIALVTQEPFLFDDTLRANIAHARPNATDAEVEAAARAAAAHEFIETLPKGYLTQVGEAGARLSGGQRQRIAIARAFLKNAPILLLDEATSALDTESEAKVQAALERLMAGRTTFLIAHRLSTVRAANRIYVIEGGRVVEVGDHASLAAQGGLYARLARAQNLDVITRAAS